MGSRLGGALTRCLGVADMPDSRARVCVRQSYYSVPAEGCRWTGRVQGDARLLPQVKENKGETLFKRYLDRWGYGDYEHHPDLLNPPKQPDYLIRTARGEVVAEVKSFDGWGLLEKLKDEPFAMESLEETLDPIREAIKEAAKQLKGIKGRPLVVALASPDNRIPVSAFYVISAMYGELALSVPLDKPRSQAWHTGRNGRLYIPDGRGVKRGFHPYLSAIAVIHERSLHASPTASVSHLGLPAEPGFDAVVTLDVFETISDQCVPLPRTLFAHAGDERWTAQPGDMYGRLEADTGASIGWDE
jgi:hypothetical protein